MAKKLVIKQGNEKISVLDESEMFSGSYDDLTDKPSIPSDVEDLNPSTATFTITYTDDSTEDVEVVIIPNNSSGE